MINTSLCYITHNGKTLLLHRVKKQNDANQGKWIGIGGKFEPGESPEDCVLREVKEETGLTLTRFSYRGIVTFASDRWPTEYMHLFTATDFSGELTECDEGELQWVESGKQNALPMWQGDKVFFRLLAESRPFFSLKLVYRGDDLIGAVLNGAPLNLADYL